jgi:hypothetical protein
MKLHVHGFGVFGLDDTVYDAFGSRVVSFDGCWGLGMPLFFQFVADFR